MPKTNNTKKYIIISRIKVRKTMTSHDMHDPSVVLVSSKYLELINDAWDLLLAHIVSLAVVVDD